jgi:hypothetical protein
VRNHAGGDNMPELPELERVHEPVAVIIRPDGSVDSYGYVAVIDQRA